MGMSHDFEVAIEEGATMVRVGTAIFGERVSMKVTPLDLRQQRFNTVMRGYDRGEVNAFLAEAAEDYETALRENDRLRQELAKLEAVLKEHRGQEINLRNTLMTAQKLADDIKEGAAQDAARILREAESRADLLLQKAQARLEDVQREIDGLRMKRREVETSLEGIISTINNTISFVREQDAARLDEKILLHRPRQPEVPAAAPTMSPLSLRHGHKDENDPSVGGRRTHHQRHLPGGTLNWNFYRITGGPRRKTAFTPEQVFRAPSPGHRDCGRAAHHGGPETSSVSHRYAQQDIDVEYSYVDNIALIPQLYTKQWQDETMVGTHRLRALIVDEHQRR